MLDVHSVGNGSSTRSYPIRGVGNQDPLYWTQIQLVINCIYLLYIISLLIAVWRLEWSNERRQSRPLRLIFASMLLIGVTTIFTVCSKSLFLADAYVGLNYQMSKGVFALFYFPGEAFLIAAIFSALADRLKTITLDVPAAAKRVPAIRLLYKFIVGIAFIFAGILIVVHFTYAQHVIFAVRGSYQTDPLSQYPAGWSGIAASYHALTLVVGFNFLGFSIYLSSCRKKQASLKCNEEFENCILLCIVSPAVNIHGLFGTTMNGFIFDSLPLKLASAEPYSWLDLVRDCIDPICLAVIFAGMVWIPFKQQKLAAMATNINLTDTRDPENGIPST